MKVSVIIPVYNTGQYIEQAVSSALEQPETAEVILVDDGSSDNSLTICQHLSEAEDRVHLYTHHWPRKHRGISASRNLGIRKSTQDYIAFLDCDDYYLPGRFTVDREVFEANPDADGVYDAVRVEYLTEERREQWYIGKMLTMREPVSPEDLFETLVLGKKGQFCTNGIVVRRRLFDRTGGSFRNHLRVHQDTEMWLRMAASAKLLPGSIEKPVAVYQIHPSNTYLQPRAHIKELFMQVQAYAVLWRWGRWHLPAERKKFLYYWFFFLSSRLVKLVLKEGHVWDIVYLLPVLSLLSSPYLFFYTLSARRRAASQ